jgi:hypothetical protein
MNILRNPDILRPVGLTLVTTLLAVGATACESKKHPAPSVSPSPATSAAPIPAEQMPSCTISAQPLGNRTEEFHLSTQDDPYPTDEYRFVFGDGNSSNEKDDTVRHTYAQTGTYTVAAFLQVQNEQGLPPIKGISCRSIAVTIG